jgi:NAD(P)-dependent dehydrogenase (short-subunit alcohol dehydrogenase family)
MTDDMEERPVALVTGASAGLGLALARSLAARGWRLVLDARAEDPLRRVERELSEQTPVAAVRGDVADSWHRVELATAAEAMRRLDLVVHNASRLGPSPQPRLADYPIDELRAVYEVDVFAPLALTQLLLPLLAGSGTGTIVCVSSDAATQAYPGWGGYGSAKAALDQVSAVLAAEHEDLRVYAFDPGDLRTAMHQRAFPGEDISDRPEPESVLPAWWRLIDERPPSGRYRAADLAATPLVAP